MKVRRFLWLFMSSVLLLFVVFLLFQAPTSHNEDVVENLPMRLEEGLTFRVYYGSLDEQIVQDLLQYNLVILEPAQVSDEELFALQAADVKVVGYLSVFEVGKWDKELLDMLSSEDILMKETDNKGPIFI